MLFRFKSQATPNLTLLQADGETVLRLLGKEPNPTGVITTEQLPAAIATLDAAAKADRVTHRTRADDAGYGAVDDAGEDCEDDMDTRVALAQRLSPVIQMLRQAQHEQKAVVWGV